MAEWTTICRPVETGGVRGMGVLLVNDNEEWEVGRVAFVRKQSDNPDVSFEKQLDAIIAKADAAADAANDLMAELRRQHELAEEKRRRHDDDAIDQGLARIRELLKDLPTTMT